MRILALLIATATLTACSGHPFQSFVSSGERYFAAGQYPEAVIQFQNAARIQPDSAAAQMKLGRAYAALHQPADAAAAYELACSIDKGDSEACLAAASQLLEIGQYDRAASEARNVLVKDHTNLDAQLVLASALAGVRRFADAEQRIVAALETSPKSARAYRTLGEVQWQRGNADAAEASLLKSIDLDSTSTGSRVTLAELYFQTERAADGARQLRSALDVNPTDLEANRLYAGYLVGTNQCEDAEPYWKNVATQSPDGSGALALADYYMFSGRSDDALRVLEPLAAKREAGPAGTRVAAILYDRGDRAKAGQVVDELITTDPSNVEALVLKARISLNEHNVAQAREYAHRAATMAPRAASVREVLAAIGTDGN
jgi:tetratricopeptide (TPR) repeat protein